ncbi:hypothetical protein BaRGS_00006216, partial [Batillaria attramentaria]
QSQAELKNRETVFVETQTFKDSVELLRQHGLLVVCGSPGSGKSYIACALLRQFAGDGFTPLVLHRYEEWRQYVGGDRKQIILLDNLFGDVCLNRKTFCEWSKTFTSMSEFVRESKCLVVITMYTHVLREIQGSQTCGVFFNGVSTVDVCFGQGISVGKKKQMIRKHLRSKGHPDEEVDKSVRQILRADKSGSVFPWCLERYAEMPVTDLNREHVFSTQAWAYAHFLRKCLQDTEGRKIGRVLAAILFALSATPRTDTFCLNEALQDERIVGDLKKCDAVQIDTVLQHYVEGYFSRDLSAFLSTVRESSVLALGVSDYHCKLLDVCDVGLLLRFVRTHISDNLTIRVQGTSYQSFHKRVLEEIVQGNILQITTHPSLQNREYLEDFKQYLLKTESLRTLLTVTDGTCKETLLYCSALHSSIVLTEWCVACMEEQEMQTEAATCLVRILFLCALRGERTSSPVMKSTTSLFKRVGESAGEVDGVRFTMNSFQQSAQMLSELFAVNRFFYLHNENLPIPHTIVTPRISGNELALNFPTKLWYLALRLLADKEVDEKDDEDNTLLHLAADTGDLDAVKIAVKSGASLTARNKAGDRPFQLALKRRNENDTESAATPEVSTEAFRKACRTGNLEVVKICLCYNAGIHDRDENGNTPFHLAYQNRQSEVSDFLLEISDSLREYFRYMTYKIAVCVTRLIDEHRRSSAMNAYNTRLSSPQLMPLSVIFFCLLIVLCVLAMTSAGPGVAIVFMSVVCLLVIVIFG